MAPTSPAQPSVVQKEEKKVAKKLKIVTSLPVLGAIARDIGGTHVEVQSLLMATSEKAEDPHVVKDRPNFKGAVSHADLFIQVGRSLELWSPAVIKSSGNQKLISGQGVVNASEGVPALEVPKELTRAHGDIHPQGNPHIWLSPRAALIIAENIKKALIKTDIEHASDYETNFTNFKNKLSTSMFGQELVKKANNNDYLWRLHQGNKLNEYITTHKLKIGGWLQQAAKIDYAFYTYHTVFSYLAQDFALKIAGQIEEKAGVPPSSKYQKELIKNAQARGVKHIVAASYYLGNSKVIDYIAKNIGAKKIFVTVDSAPGQSYIDFMNNLLTTLVKFK
jgi:zinc/manganese transport system substrate-binding protein